MPGMWRSSRFQIMRRCWVYAELNVILRSAASSSDLTAALATNLGNSVIAAQAAVVDTPLNGYVQQPLTNVLIAFEVQIQIDDRRRVVLRQIQFRSGIRAFFVPRACSIQFRM